MIYNVVLQITIFYSEVIKWVYDLRLGNPVRVHSVIFIIMIFSRDYDLHGLHLHGLHLHGLHLHDHHGLHLHDHHGLHLHDHHGPHDHHEHDRHVHVQHFMRMD